MSKANAPVSINILGKEYKILCAPEEQSALMASARALDSQMRKIRDTGKVNSTDNIAVLAALNMVQVEQAKPVSQANQQSEVQSQLNYLREKIEKVLDQ